MSEGWHGVRFADPLGRTREYVQIVRQALKRRRVTAGGDALHAAVARRPGQVAGAVPAAGAPGDPDLPGRARPEEPRPDRRDRRRLAGHLLRPGRRPAVACARIRDAATAAGRDPAAIDICASVPVSVARRPAGRRRPGARARRALHRRHGVARRRTSTTAPRPRWVTAQRPTRCRTGSWPATTPGRRRPCRTSSSTGPACSATQDRIADAAAPPRRGRGHQSISVSCFDRDLEAKIAHPDHGDAGRRPARGHAGEPAPGDHPRHRRGPHRIPAGLVDRPPDHRRRTAWACRSTTRPSRRSSR